MLRKLILIVQVIYGLCNIDGDIQPLIDKSIRKLLGTRADEVRLMTATPSNFNVPMGYISTSFYPNPTLSTAPVCAVPFSTIVSSFGLCYTVVDAETLEPVGESIVTMIYPTASPSVFTQATTFYNDSSCTNGPGMKYLPNTTVSLHQCTPPDATYLVNGILRYPFAFSHSVQDVSFQSTPPPSSVVGVSLTFYRSVLECAQDLSVTNQITFAYDTCMPDPVFTGQPVKGSEQYFVKFECSSFSEEIPYTMTVSYFLSANCFVPYQSSSVSVSQRSCAIFSDFVGSCRLNKSTSCNNQYESGYANCTMPLTNTPKPSTAPTYFFENQGNQNKLIRATIALVAVMFVCILLTAGTVLYLGVKFRKSSHELELTSGVRNVIHGDMERGNNKVERINN